MEQRHQLLFQNPKRVEPSFLGWAGKGRVFSFGGVPWLFLLVDWLSSRQVYSTQDKTLGHEGTPGDQSHYSVDGPGQKQH